MAKLFKAMWFGLYFFGVWGFLFWLSGFVMPVPLVVDPWWGLVVAYFVVAAEMDRRGRVIQTYLIATVAVATFALRYGYHVWHLDVIPYLLAWGVLVFGLLCFGVGMLFPDAVKLFKGEEEEN